MPKDSSLTPLNKRLAIMLMRLIDMQSKVRQQVDIAFLRRISILLLIALMGVAGSSIYALWQVTQHLESVVNNSMVGLETAVSMRSTIRESWLDVQRSQIGESRSYSKEKAARAQIELRKLLKAYRSVPGRDNNSSNLKLIEERADRYFELATKIEIDSGYQDDVFQSISQAARVLVDAISNEYEFNKKASFVATEEARDLANRALTLASLLSWMLIFVTLGLYFVFLVNKWLVSHIVIDE